MTATVSQVENAVIAQLATITGLRAWSYLPDSFTTPCAIVAVGEIDYHGSFGQGDVPHHVPVLLIVARSSERSGQNSLDDYRSYSGANSVRAAIEADPTLGGVVSTSSVIKSGNHLAISINGVEYLSVQFDLIVHA